MARTPLVVLGTSGLALEIAQLARQVDEDGRRWHLLGFVGDASVEVGTSVGRGRVIGSDDWLASETEVVDVLVGIGRPAIRRRVIERLKAARPDLTFPNLIHPKATVDHREVVMGEGNAVTAGCVFTVDVALGSFNYINLLVTVGHNARLGDFNVINPGSNISGNVVIENDVLVGTGAQILEGRTVGSRSTVGAGALVTSDIAPDVVVVGVPARPLQK